MLRFVSLVRVHEGTDLDAIVSAGTKMREEDADIQSGFVVAAWAFTRLPATRPRSHSCSGPRPGCPSMCCKHRSRASLMAWRRSRRR